jgi:hypothetical protein
MFNVFELGQPIVSSAAGRTLRGMTSDQETRTHEAGHQVLGVLAFGWEPGPITVARGGLAFGCSAMTPPDQPPWEDGMDQLPFALWPQEHQSWLQEAVLVELAGDVAVCVLQPLSDHEEPAVATEAIAIVEDRPPTEAERQWAAEAVSDPLAKSDPEKVARLARFAHRDDRHSAGAWVAYLHAQCMALVEHHEQPIRALAGHLRENPILSAEAVAAVLAKYEPAALVP